ncbi:MAG: type III-A CRISPR-associated protein Csm2 [Nitrospiraceae bacterium]|nr:type III-A CRISPR-associated protein Csm2 [Nitrospiraceae bacterium]
MTTFKLWKDKDKGLLDPGLFSSTAEELAKRIGTEDNRKNKGTQLRRFFDELIRINTKAQSKEKEDDWAIIHPLVHMMIAKAVYAQGRGLVTRSFVDLMRNGIKQIQDRNDLDVFTNFMECFIGFYKLYGPK